MEDIVGKINKRGNHNTLSPPSSFNSSLSDFPSPICINLLLDEEEDNNNMIDIKAALLEEFSGETGDANRWLMAMEAYFTLYANKFPNEVQTVVFLNRMSKRQGKPFAKALLQFSFFILISFYSLHFLYIVPGILLISSPLIFFLSLYFIQLFSIYSKIFDDIAILLSLMLYSITFYEVLFLT